jgi:nucleotide-binding universal stress UspA family protein
MMDVDGCRLVFGDDGSAAADVAWLWISNHRWPGWTISVVTAHQPDAVVSAAAQAEPHPWPGDGSRQLRVGPDVTSLEFLLAEADRRVVLNSFHDAQLMVIGPRGKGLLKHLHLGSTADWLLHRPPAPLAVIRSARPTRRLLVCVDGSAAAHEAAVMVSRLPWIGDCRVVVLGVVASGPAQEHVERGITQAVGVFELAGATCERQMRGALRGTYTFDVRSAILALIEEEQPDLVVTGTRGLGGVQRLMLGSTASAIVHHAPCSTLVVPGRPTSSGMDSVGS